MCPYSMRIPCSRKRDYAQWFLPHRAIQGETKKNSGEVLVALHLSKPGVHTMPAMRIFNSSSDQCQFLRGNCCRLLNQIICHETLVPAVPGHPGFFGVRSKRAVWLWQRAHLHFTPAGPNGRRYYRSSISTVFRILHPASGCTGLHAAGIRRSHHLS